MSKKTQLTTEEYNAVYDSLNHIIGHIQERHAHYPTDVFIPVKYPDVYKTPDGAAAAMARFTCESLVKEIQGMRSKAFWDELRKDK